MAFIRWQAEHVADLFGNPCLSTADADPADWVALLSALLTWEPVIEDLPDPWAFRGFVRSPPWAEELGWLSRDAALTSAERERIAAVERRWAAERTRLDPATRVRDRVRDCMLRSPFPAPVPAELDGRPIRFSRFVVLYRNWLASALPPVDWNPTQPFPRPIPLYWPATDPIASPQPATPSALADPGASAESASGEPPSASEAAPGSQPVPGDAAGPGCGAERLRVGPAAGELLVHVAGDRAEAWDEVKAGWVALDLSVTERAALNALIGAPRGLTRADLGDAVPAADPASALNAACRKNPALAAAVERPGRARRGPGGRPNQGVYRIRAAQPAPPR